MTPPILSSPAVLHDAVAVGMGAVLGALTRYQCGRLAAEYIAADASRKKMAGWHTAAINIGGSFLLGTVTGAPTPLHQQQQPKRSGSGPFGSSASSPRSPFLPTKATAPPPPSAATTMHRPLLGAVGGGGRFGLTPRARLLLGVGFCGSFTTYSTYSVDVANWVSQGRHWRALSYVLANNVGSIAAAAAGMALVRKLFGP
jgi:fluoride ion exporter CrcB/FEX